MMRSARRFDWGQFAVGVSLYGRLDQTAGDLP